MSNYARGSEWRQWDLHVHSPASFHWNGERFDRTLGTAKNQALVDQMVAALNAAAPDVYCLMDYWTFAGWFELKRRLAQEGATALRKKVFPGIELRLVSPTRFRLNAHVLFSDEITDQQLLDFRSALRLDVSGRPLSDEALVEVARAATVELLRNKGFSKEEVDSDEAVALKAGSTIAEINCDSYRDAITKVPNGHAIGFMPFDTSDGLVGVDRNEHYSYFIGLFQSSPIFESRNQDLRGAFVNEVMPGNQNFITAFQTALGNVPRLVVSGSDAHRFTGTPGDNDKRGYGDFPSGKATWIKADPSFKGLQQAIMEPAKRSFIGETPQKLAEILGNRTYFVDRVKIGKIEDSKLDAHWLDGCDIPLSSDLTAIIGNKGSGKSALADIIALLGCSRQKQHFSFLKKDRFRGKSGDPAKQFVARLEWLDGSVEELRLDQDPAEEKVEMVRYIPQGHFEALCNDHVAGRSNAFENELRAVIFSHLEESTRLGALSFDQLINQQESTFRDQLLELRKQLQRINQDISVIESQMRPEVMANLKEQQALKQKQIEEHDAQKPPVVEKPTEELSDTQKAATAALEKIAADEKAAAEQQTKSTEQTNTLSAKLRAVRKLKERVKLLQRAFTQFEEEVRGDIAIAGLEVEQIAKLTVDLSKLDELETSLPLAIEEIRKAGEELTGESEKRLEEKKKQNDQLNGPQLKYQQFLQATLAWQKKREELTGAADQPETLKGIENQIAQVDGLPASLEASSAIRAKLSGEIFDVLEALRVGRATLFKPLHELLDSNQLIRDEYKLRFEATLVSSPEVLSEDLFSMVKQNSGEFHGADESFAYIRKLTEKYDFGKKEDVLAFIEELRRSLTVAANKGDEKKVGLHQMLRKDKEATDVYNLLFGLEFLSPRYSLQFQDTQIEQLSPGQRGALLLIFYLLVDKGRNPIILDQPEENLDNETVVNLLVPVLTEAKKRRQIIMVTHNPNLAVVCDAEQIIYAKFERRNFSKISYSSGSIEHPPTNAHVVKVLEGTKPAFDNRKRKYH